MKLQTLRASPRSCHACMQASLEEAKVRNEAGLDYVIDLDGKKPFQKAEVDLINISLDQ